MAKAGRQNSKKRARRPRRQLRFALDEVLPKDKADALKRWLAVEKTTLAAAREKAEQLDAGRREIDRYIAIRDNQIRPPWMDAPKRRRKKKRGRGAPVEFNLDGGITTAASAVAEKGVDDQQSDFIMRVYGELERLHIKAPGLTWMKKHIGALHKRLRRAARRSR
jgi:hypothetical protein